MKGFSSKAAGDSQFICSLFGELHVCVVSSRVHVFAYYPNQGSDSHRLEFESKTLYHSAGQTLSTDEKQQHTVSSSLHSK